MKCKYQGSEDCFWVRGCCAGCVHEDEYDTDVANKAYDEYEKNGKKSRPIAELWKETNMTNFLE